MLAAAIAFACAAAIALTIALCGCGGQPVLGREGFVGHWTFLSHVNGEGASYSAEELSKMGVNPDSLMSFDLGAEGDAHLKSSDADLAEADEEVTWVTTPDGISLRSGGSSVDLEYNEETGCLTMTTGDNGSTVFAKQ